MFQDALSAYYQGCQHLTSADPLPLGTADACGFSLARTPGSFAQGYGWARTWKWSQYSVRCVLPKFDILSLVSLLVTTSLQFQNSRPNHPNSTCTNYSVQVPVLPQATMYLGYLCTDVRSGFCRAKLPGPRISALCRVRTLLLL